MKNLQKLRANKTKNNENDESSIENIGLFDTLIKTVSGAVVLGVLFYVNSSEFDLHNRSKRALDYFETPERLDDIAPVHLVADNDFDSMHRRKNRDLDDFSDFLEGENLDESENEDNSTAEFQSFLSEIGIQDAGEFNLMAEIDEQTNSDSTSSTDILDENGSGIDLGVFDYDASADGSGFNDYSDEDEMVFARSFSETSENSENAGNAKKVKITRRRGRGPRKNRRKNRERPINWNRLKTDDLEKIAPKMHAKFDERMTQFTNVLQNVSLAVEDPEKMAELGYDDFKGHDRTAPMVNKFINALNCNKNGEGLFKQPGKTSIYVLFPGAVSLFSEPGKVVEDYGYFWKWWMKIAELLPTDRFNNVRFSVGVYSTSAAFTPKGFKPRINMPWERLQRFYKAPRMTAVQPSLLTAAARVNTWVYSYGSSTPMVGDNCIFFWFVHNVQEND